MGHNTAKSGNSLLMFRDNLLVPSSRVKKPKTEQSTIEVNCLKLPFWDNVSEAGSVSVFRQSST